MADRKGTLIHEPPSPSQPHRPDVDKDPPPAPCIGCRSFHGGVGAERICLRTTIIHLRSLYAAALQEKDTEILRLRTMLQEFEPK